MQKLYGIGQYDSCEHFLYLKARRFGNIGRGGIPDIFTSARSLVEDWNRYVQSNLQVYLKSSIPQIFSQSLELSIILLSLDNSNYFAGPSTLSLPRPTVLECLN